MRLSLTEGRRFEYSFFSQAPRNVGALYAHSGHAYFGVALTSARHHSVEIQTGTYGGNQMSLKTTFFAFLLIYLVTVAAFAVDSDNDGLSDDIEAQLGTSSLHKDIFVEIDWLIVHGRNMKPRPGFIQIVAGMFENAPVVNPDSTYGIRLHALLSNGIPSTKDVLGTQNENGSYDWSDFDVIKSQYFTPTNRATHHYCLFVKDYAAYDQDGNLTGSSGLSRNSESAFSAGASDFIVSLGGNGWWNKPKSATYKWTQAGTFVHELGHNLGLKHGGSDHVSYKPNHLSVMSYAFQTDGIPFTTVDGTSFSYFDYSRVAPPPLNENSINEVVGLGSRVSLPGVGNYGTRWYLTDGQQLYKFYWTDATSGVDWNMDGVFQTGLKIDLNILFPYVILGNQVVFRPLSTLKGGIVEWTRLYFRGGAIGKAVTELQAALPRSTPQLHCLTSRDYAMMHRHPEPDLPRVTYSDLLRYLHKKHNTN